MEEEMKLKCPRCNKSDVRFRIRTNSFVCNKCGFVWGKEEDKLC